ncbi:hypothetical protein O6H91_09G077000 [Diphasiastrum complanatum]|uniref:Uncharacterized protein n=1 Tax=Diphasiastrum complanatum TaxID=34168 RepID=A0ACC2CR04_DIPCM|nr:hypothetical protein O6H91_09G077000 [Diphasiastrum complanatum]
MMQKFGLSNKETLLKHLPTEDRSWMESKMTRERRGAGHKAVENTLTNREYKLATIANPANGQGFFHVIYSSDWTLKGWWSLRTSSNLLLLLASAQQSKYNSLLLPSVPFIQTMFMIYTYVCDLRKKEVVACLAGDKQQRDALDISSDNKSCKNCQHFLASLRSKLAVFVHSFGSNLSHV